MGRARRAPRPPLTGSRRVRAGVVVVEDGRVALIKRVREGRTYYTVPGGGVEPGETVEQAAIREAREELGLEVALTGLLATLEFAGVHHYYRADAIGGELGTGTWPDHAARDAVEREKRGTYEAMWVDVDRLAELDVRPRELVRLLRA